MTAIYASTTHDWFHYLSSLKTTETVAFWQPTPANPRQIRPSEPWYFKQLKRPIILGSGLFVHWEKLTAAELFRRYGHRTGYETFSQLLMALSAFRTNTTPDTEVGNVVLREFNPFNTPIALADVGLKDLSVRYNYVPSPDPLARYIHSRKSLTVEKQPAPIHGLATTGPIPSSGTGEYVRDFSDGAHTYAIRFGMYDIWKIGWAKDVKKRLHGINTHIPDEIIPHKWTLAYTHSWRDVKDAYFMEQTVLRILSAHRTKGERLKCSESELVAGWAGALTATSLDSAARAVAV